MQTEAEKLSGGLTLVVRRDPDGGWRVFEQERPARMTLALSREVALERWLDCWGESSGVRVRYV